MKTKFSFLGLTILSFLFCGSVNATDYTLSTATITISTPGSHTITGTGSGRVDINSSVNDAVFEITLDNMTLNAAEWASAISCNNNSTGTMTVKFIITGTNVTRGYNHGGIKVGTGNVNVIFTTVSSGTLTVDAVYESNFAFQNDTNCVLNPSIDSNVICTATLEGNAVTNLSTALSEAFTKKPLVLTLATKPNSIDDGLNASSIKIKTFNDKIQIEGLKIGETFSIYDISGKCVINSKATNNVETLILSKGIYIIRTLNATLKFSY